MSDSLESVLDPREAARVNLLNPENYRYRHLVPHLHELVSDATDIVQQALDRGELSAIPKARMLELYESMRWQGGGYSKLADAMDKYLLRREDQIKALEGVNASAILEMVSQGFLPGEISEYMGVSYQIIHAYLLRAASNEEDVEAALELCGDMQALRGLKDIEDSNENSKAGVQKGVELAKHRLAIARALNPKRYSEKPMPLIAAGGDAGGGGIWLQIDVTSNLVETDEAKRARASQKPRDVTPDGAGDLTITDSPPLPATYTDFEPVDPTLAHVLGAVPDE